MSPQITVEYHIHPTTSTYLPSLAMFPNGQQTSSIHGLHPDRIGTFQITLPITLKFSILTMFPDAHSAPQDKSLASTHASWRQACMRLACAHHGYLGYLHIRLSIKLSVHVNMPAYNTRQTRAYLPYPPWDMQSKLSTEGGMPRLSSGNEGL
jgi:hypothetical protein